MITEIEWKAALSEAKIRIYSQLTWTNLHEKFVNAVDVTTGGHSLTMTLASSDDPSELHHLLMISLDDKFFKFDRKGGRSPFPYLVGVYELNKT